MLKYVHPQGEHEKVTPKALIGVTQMDDDSLLPVFVLKMVLVFLPPPADEDKLKKEIEAAKDAREKRRK